VGAACFKGLGPVVGTAPTGLLSKFEVARAGQIVIEDGPCAPLASELLLHLQGGCGRTSTRRTHTLPVRRAAGLIPVDRIVAIKPARRLRSLLEGLNCRLIGKCRLKPMCAI
jgi:hypothetical protein